MVSASAGWLMGLDLGGGGVRCLLVDPVDARVVTASEAWRPTPVRDVLMGSEYDAEDTWGALVRVARAALARAGDDAHVLGIATTSMRHGSALLDAAGNELLMTANRDARGAGAAHQLGLERGAELHRVTGHWPNPVQPAPRLRWCATQRPEMLRAAATHLALSDWMAFRLCGERATDPTQAGESLLLHADHPEWAWDVVDSLELPRSLFPEVRAPGSPLGTLRGQAAAALGLPAGVPVAVGGADTQCALAAAGALAPGSIGVVAGTTAPVVQVCPRRPDEAEGRLWTGHHLVAQRWVLESNAGGVGEALEWLAALLFGDAEHPILHLLAEASASPPGNAGFLSSFGFEVMDARRMQLPVGDVTLNPLTSADDPHARGHLARAVFEGVAFGLRENLEQLTRETGDPGGALRVTGGLAHSPFFTQLLADTLDRDVEVAAPAQASALGAALCAGVGAGVFGHLEQAAAALARVQRRHAPERVARERYAALREPWRDVREARLPSDALAAQVAAGALALGGSADSGAAPGFRPRIFVSADLDEETLAALRALGDVEYQSYRTAMRLLTGASLAKALAGVHVLVTEVDVVDASALLAASDLRVIGVCRGDAVNVDLAACEALGIAVFNTPGRNAHAVADLALAFLLALARKLPEANAFLREPGGEAGDMGRMGRAFGQLRGRELWRKTIGLVGLGAVGRKVLARLRPFGARCLVHDPYLSDDAVRLAGAEPARLDELLARSDFVSLHCAVSDETRGLIGAAELARMRQGACLVNTARAALVDEAALVAALAGGHLAGAALDVFAEEPPAWDAPLLQLANVIATPHIGGNTEEVAAHQGRIVVEELGRLARREPLQHALCALPSDADWARPRPPPAAGLAERLAKSAGPAVTDLQRDRKTPRPAAAPSAPPGTGGAQVEELREGMEKLLREFIDSVRADPALGAFAAGAGNVTLHFTLTDLGTSFHVGFRDGGVLGALAAPESAADVVQLKMRADLFDGMLTGRSNAMQAAMNGELSFSGDTAKAMTLQQINADLSRIYRAARDATGDPGDLAALPQPGSAAGPPPAARSQGTDVRHELCRIVDELYVSQLITATGGNVSARVEGAPDQAWITPSQLFKGDLAPEILVRIGMDGKALDEGARSPSSEALMHTAVLSAKPEAQAVIHCHAPNATILVNAGLPFLPVSTEAAFFRDIGRIPFVMPGTQELADAIVEAMGEGWAVLMQNHGLLVAGRTLRRAADMAEIIERTAQVILGCRAVGVEPPVLPPKVVEMLAKYGDLMA